MPSNTSPCQYNGALKHHLGGLAAFGVALLITSGSLWALQAWWPQAGQGAEVMVLVLANATATLVRFLLLRLLMHPRPPAPDGALSPGFD